jgi:hypothetical protein
LHSASRLRAHEIGWLAIAPLPPDLSGYLMRRDFVATRRGAKAALAGNPAQYFG